MVGCPQFLGNGVHQDGGAPDIAIEGSVTKTCLVTIDLEKRHFQVCVANTTGKPPEAEIFL